MDQDSINIVSPQGEEKAGQEKVSAVSARDYVKTVLVTLAVAMVLKMFVVEAYRIPSGSMENTLLVGDFLLVNKLAYGARTPRTIPFTNVKLSGFTLPLVGGVERGDVVVFEFPQSPEAESADQVNYIKRCIGLPGDTVLIREGSVFVNGKEMSLPPNAKKMRAGSSAWEMGIRSVPGGRGFTEDDYGPIVVPRKGDRLRLKGEAMEEWKALILQEGHRLYRGADDIVYVDGEQAEEYYVERDYYFVLGDNRHNSLDSRFWGFVPDDNLVGEALMIYWSWDPDITVMSARDKIASIRWNRIGSFIR